MDQHYLNIKQITEDQLSILQEEFYSYFDDGYMFEKFLKEFLIKIGLDEVELTQKSKDGGIDLKAIRKGIGDFSKVDITNYRIQAKRYLPKNKISVAYIRQLKGSILSGEKGIFITTSDFTDNSKEEAMLDPTRQIILIDGKSLIKSCIDNGIGFIFEPKFSKTQMDLFFKEKINEPLVNNISFIEKTITQNDIRSRIISIPSSIMKQISGNKIKVQVNYKYHYRIINF